jgi:hypothetical protein
LVCARDELGYFVDNGDAAEFFLTEYIGVSVDLIKGKVFKPFKEPLTYWEPCYSEQIEQQFHTGQCNDEKSNEKKDNIHG